MATDTSSGVAMFIKAALDDDSFKKAAKQAIAEAVKMGDSVSDEVAESIAEGTVEGFERAYKKEFRKAFVKGVIRSIVDPLKKGLKTGLKTAFSGLKGLASGLFDKIRGGSQKASMGLKQFVMAGMGIATLYAGLRRVLNYAREGFDNLSQASGTTRGNVQNMSASLQYLKNALGACIAPIYNVIAPALSKFIDMLASAVNAFGKFVSALTGGRGLTVVAKKTFAGISDGASGAGSAMGDASDSAKELKRQLMGFDKIEKLDSIADSLSNAGSGGGGGGGGSAFDDMFETVDTGETANKWADLVKESWQKADFTAIGKIVGDKLADALDKIPWDKIKTNAGKIGKSLATFLNGILDSEKLFPNIGKTIGEALNTGLEAAYQFVTNFNFKKFGTRIGEAINSAVQTFDWAKAGISTGEWIKGLLDILNGTLQKTNWKQLGEKVALYITSIDWSGIIAKAFESLGSLAGAFAGFIAGLASGFKKKWGEYFTKNFLDDEGKVTWESFCNGVVQAVKDIASWIKKNIFDPFIQGFKKAFGINSPSTVMKEQGGFVMSGFLNGLTGGLKSILDFFTGLVSKVAGFFKDPIGTVKVAVDKGVEKAKELWDGFKNSTVVKTLTEKGKEVVEKAKGVWDGIKNSEAVKTLKETGSTIVQKAGAIFSGIKSDTVTKTLKETGSAVIQKAKDIFSFGNSTATKTTKGVTDKSFTNAQSIFDKFKSAIATKTSKGSTDKTFTETQSIFDKFKSAIATKTSKGATDKTFTSTQSAFDKFKNAVATKTISGATDKAFTSAKATYEALKNATAKKTITGATDKTFTANRTTYDALKNAIATKTIKGATDKTFTSNKSTYDALKNASAIKSIDSGFTNWTKWKERKGYYDAVAGKSVNAVYNSWFKDWTAWSKKKGYYDAVKNKTVTVTYDAKASNSWQKAASSYNTIRSVNTTPISVSFAKGGAFYSGGWHKIPQAASGGIFRGTLFNAGEAGPEIVAKARGGRSEVLNASQIASSVASGVGMAFSKLTIRMPNPAPQLAFVERMQAQTQKNQEETDGRLQSIIGLMVQVITAIKEIDTDQYWDGKKVTDEIVKELNRRTRATGVCEILI